MILADWPSAQFVKAIYDKQGTDTGNGKLYLHDDTLANSAGDGSYRYAGSNPNNYVCFNDGGAGKCTDANKFRIIGLFGDNVKLIKPISINKRNWDDSKNTWEGSAIEKHINSAYLNSLGGRKDFILNDDWNVGGIDTRSLTPKNAYQNEISNNQTIKNKIGLLYASDFGFTSIDQYWNLSLDSNTNSVSYGWLVIYNTTDYEWTILRHRSNSTDSFRFRQYQNFPIFSLGTSSANSQQMVRPSFYIKATTPMNSGNGSTTTPYIIG